MLMKHVCFVHQWPCSREITTFFFFFLHRPHFDKGDYYEFGTEQQFSKEYTQYGAFGDVISDDTHGHNV